MAIKISLINCLFIALFSNHQVSAGLSNQATDKCKHSNQDKLDLASAESSQFVDLAKESSWPQTGAKCSKNGVKKCSHLSKTGYYECTNSTWVSHECTGANFCTPIGDDVKCDPISQPAEHISQWPQTGANCSNNGVKQCSHLSKTGYYECTNSTWVSHECTGANFCTPIGDDVKCDPITQPAQHISQWPQTGAKCSNNGVKKCSHLSKTGYYECTNSTWVSHECTGANFCTPIGDDISCDYMQ